jgi:glucose/arabinose dehydrogenase
VSRRFAFPLTGMAAVAGLLAAPGCSGAGAGGRAHAAAVKLVRVGTFGSPTYVTSPPGDRRRLFVTQRSGAIAVVRDGHRLATPFLDLRGRVRTDGEAGLLSMAFAPDYASSRRFYVYFIDLSGAIRIEEFRRSESNPDRARASSRRLVLRQRHRHPNHKGGQLQFGPDRLLYVGFGDGGSEGDPDRNGQDRRTLLGKLLRIDPRPSRHRRYRIPRSNPFFHRHGVRKEIWAVGLRNPWRFSFDRVKGHLTIGDVGQDAVEEIDLVRSRRRGHPPRGGMNFGWSVFEGRRHYNPGHVRRHFRPVLQRLHSQGSCAITAGYVVRDHGLGSLYGRYLYGDLCDPHLRVVRFRHGRARGDHRLGPRVPELASFGEDAAGRVYALSLEGRVYRLAARR